MSAKGEILDNKTPDERFWIVIWIILAITLVEACAQTSLKTARVKNNKLLIPAGVFFYAVVAGLLYVAYKYEGMGHANLIWSCASIIVAIVIGCMLFGEPHNRYTYLAVILAFLAIYFAHRADEIN